MKKISIAALLVCIIAILSACASQPKDQRDAIPAGNAIVYLANLEIEQVNGKRVSMKLWKQYEIAAGTHQLGIKYYSGPGTEARFTTEGSFEAGKTYTLIATGVKIAGKVYNEQSGLEIIEKVQPQNQIVLPNLRDHASMQIRISFNPDGSMIVVPSKRDVEIYNIANGTLVKKLSGHSKNVTEVRWNIDGTKIISRDIDSRVIIWDVSSGREIISIQEKGFSGMTLTPDGSKIIGYNGTTIKIWGSANGTELLSFKADINGNIKFSPDGQYFAASKGELMRVYSINGGEPIFTIGNDAIEWDSYRPLVFQDSNTILASRSSRRAQGNIGLVQINIKTGEEKIIDRSSFNSVAYNASSKNLIGLIIGVWPYTSYNERGQYISIFDGTGRVVKKFTCPMACISTFDVSTSGKKIATLSPIDGILRFWDF